MPPACRWSRSRREVGAGDRGCAPRRRGRTTPGAALRPWCGRERVASCRRPTDGGAGGQRPVPRPARIRVPRRRDAARPSPGRSSLDDRPTSLPGRPGLRGLRRSRRRAVRGRRRRHRGQPSPHDGLPRGPRGDRRERRRAGARSLRRARSPRRRACGDGPSSRARGGSSGLLESGQGDEASHPRLGRGRRQRQGGPHRRRRRRGSGEAGAHRASLSPLAGAAAAARGAGGAGGPRSAAPRRWP